MRNFRCIGSQPVEVELDQIVVLVGPNNVGKTSILRAYELVMQHGSKAGELRLDDFPHGVVRPDAYPEIVLETVMFHDLPAERWVQVDPATQESVVRERWLWTAPGQPQKVGWDVTAGRWDDEEGPWGTPNVAKARRPTPHRVEAFDSPEEQAKQIVDLLKKALLDRFRSLQKGPSALPVATYQSVLTNLAALHRAIVEDAKDEIQRTEQKLTDIVSEVFPDHVVTFDARPEDDLDKCVSIFKQDTQLRMGHREGHQSAIEKQGSGARRTLLWAALRLLAEMPSSDGDADAPHLLLLDEPELCLHPDAIREARRALYDLPEKTNWQVMITTHSPVFIDLSRDNTSIVRVERNDRGAVSGTTIFRPSRAQLDNDDRVRLKMLNACDPHVAEFFFGGRTIIVEGDTEYTAFRFVADEAPEDFRNVHVVRARGKATIATLCKILNHFGTPYAVLHDSDARIVRTRKTRKEALNPAWSTNDSIRLACQAAPRGGVRLVASLPNFEEAFLGEEAEDEKPFAALQKLRPGGQAKTTIRSLLLALLDHQRELPPGALEWDSMDQLDVAVHGRPPPQKAVAQLNLFGGTS